ncbi:hypothetical protein U9M48_019543 [Paspalum notatum var. saurae]|uniref:Tf2-1-like SH3-like domain-containing protein n=1 Tax=Paspalum notatum var. saurae TaxID=547442 RepID=A0AAQ3TFK4_PASNO
MAKVQDPIVLESTGEKQVFGPDIIKDAEEQVKIVRENPRVARSRREKLCLAPVYIGPFKVLEKKGVVAYKLELPPALREYMMYSMSLDSKKCLRVPEEETPPEGLDVQEDLTYTEHPRRFLIQQKELPGTRGSKCASAVEASHEARGYLGKRRRDESSLP